MAIDTTSPVPEMPLLEMRGVSKRFAGVQALQDVSLSVGRGEVVALIGENGAGKSTLMKILGGVHQPDAGEILISGRPTVIRGVSDAIAAGISFIHQELNVVDNLDVAGNVFLGREPRRGGILQLVDRARMAAETQPLLDRLGLPVSADTLLEQLSLAQQQMVEIAKALSLQAQILIMDEPTSSLTLAETDRLIQVVQALRTQGVGIVYISHRLGEVTQLADRVVGLRDGRNAGGLSKSEITHENMVRLMVGRDLERFEAATDNGQRPVRLSVRGLRTRRYPNQEVSFDIHAGEILGMAGLVGAGRSEVAQTMFGVDSPFTPGTMTLDGQPMVVRSARDAIRQGLYLAPEDRRRSGVLVEMTIRENITLPALQRYASGGFLQRRRETQGAELASQSLRVKAPNVEFPVRNLSGGNQQKVVLCKWLSLGPKVLIFDEPTRGIDVGAKSEIYDLMRNLAQEGVAILMISSDMEEVLNLSDRIAVMHEGAISGFLSRSEATEESVMRLAVGNLSTNKGTLGNS
jgi:ribose transport system ATP-binding protein